MYLRYYNFEQMQDKRWKSTLLMWKLTKKGLKHGLFFTKPLYSPEVYSLSGG